MSVTIFSQKSKKEKLEESMTDSEESSTEETVQKIKDVCTDEKKLELQTKNIKKAENGLPESIKNTPRIERPFASFLLKPTKIAYEGQLTKESIVLLLRQHPITQIRKIFLTFLGLILPMFLLGTHLSNFFAPQYIVGFFLAWYVGLFGFALQSFLSWYFRIFIVTDYRIIDVDFYSMVHKDITTAKLEDVQDVNFITTGLLSSVINFGTVYIQTSSATAKAEFESVPKPSEVTRIINEMISHRKRLLRSKI